VDALEIKIRPIGIADNAAYAELIRTVFREFRIAQKGTVYTDPTTDDLYSLFQTPGSNCFVVEMNGELLGGCGIFPTSGLPEKCAELVKIFSVAGHKR
jgi:putative acetyltransferase